MSRVIQKGVVGCVLLAAAAAGRAQPVEPAEAATPRGRVRCVARDNSAPAAAELRLHGDGESWLDCDDGLPLDPGWHRVHIRLRGALAGAEVEREIRVEAGHTATLDVRFETGQLVLWAVSDGKPAAATAEVWHDGKTHGLLQQGVAARVGIGSYVVDAQAGNQRERFGAVHVSPGGRTVLVWQTKR